MKWELMIMVRPLSHNQLSKAHWSRRAAHNKRIRMIVQLFTNGLPNLDGHCAVDVVCVFNRKARRDVDNYVSTMLKPAVDGPIDSGVLTDDTPDLVVKRMPTFEVAPNKPEHMMLIIHQLDKRIGGENGG